MKTKIAADGATIKINGSLGNSWKTTIAGNRTIQLLNIDDGDMVSVTVVQATPGNFNLTWQASDLTIVWAGGQAPVLPRAVGAAATYIFVREGSNLRQISSAGALRRRITDAPAQSVSMAIGAVALIVALMGTPSGSSNIAKTPDIANYVTGSGCTLLLTGTGSAGPCNFVRRDTGSGDILLSGSGGAAVGMGFGIPNLKATSKYTDGLAWVNGAGNSEFRTISGSTLSLDGGARTITGDEANGWLLGALTTITGSTLSGNTLSAGGGVVVLNASGIVSTQAIEALSLSGRTLTVNAMAAHVNTIACYKADGVQGYMTVSATGTLLDLTCQ